MLGADDGGVDRVVKPSPLTLPTSLEVIAPGFMFVMMAIVVVVVSFIVAFVITTPMTQMGCPFGFFGICIAIGHVYQVIDSVGPLAE